MKRPALLGILLVLVVAALPQAALATNACYYCEENGLEPDTCEPPSNWIEWDFSYEN